MELRSILSQDCTLSAVQCNSKKRALEIISSTAAQHLPGYTDHELFERFLAREKLGSTGIGQGIAIPHGRLPSDSQPIAVLVQLEETIDFDAIDNQPVDIIFALLVPEQDCQLHLKTLALIAEKLNRKETLKQLRQANSAQELYQTLINA